MTPGEAEFVERGDRLLSSVRGVRQGVLFSPTFFIARSYCKGARVWMERDWQQKVVEQFVFHILRIVLSATTMIIYFEQECLKQLCVTFF